MINLLMEEVKWLTGHPEAKFRPANFHTKIECYNKLGQYECIEKELGINLITLFNLKKNGGYFKVHNKVYFVKGEDIYLNCYTFKKDLVIKIDFVIENVGSWNTSVLRYGESWALTKEELLNEQSKQTT